MDVMRYPVVCSRGTIIFPGVSSTIFVGRDYSKRALEAATSLHDNMVIVVSQIDIISEDVSSNNLYQVGTLCRVQNGGVDVDSGAIMMSTVGVKRVAINAYEDLGNLLYATCQEAVEIFGDATIERKFTADLTETIRTIGLESGIPGEVAEMFGKGVTASCLADMLAFYIPVTVEERQSILETLDVNARLGLVNAMLMQTKENFEDEEDDFFREIDEEVNKKVRQNIDKSQKEYYLREKLRVIHDELGESANKDQEIEEINKQLSEANMPKHVVNKLKEELKRYTAMPSISSEAGVVRTYMDWLLNIPWDKETKDVEDISLVEKSLDKEHFGLEKAKERIIEYIAVKQMTNSLKAPIICLAGPPGVGKTSLAKSIADALGREFVKASLGGVKDESEVRGHRRTYLGSMPGRIIQSMKKAGVVNPVFLLDEIDKMASDFKGDPTSAMLEVLDPEQNSIFSDNYLEETYDLSKVLFIATANDLGNIPAPLRDRLEIIELSSYTEQEKLMIAKNHLMNKQCKTTGLKEGMLTISDEMMLYIIRYYTREAGVRNLERTISKLCRKTALKVLKKEMSQVTITNDNIEEFLGKAPFDFTKEVKEPTVGVVTGMAYTQFGGDILPIEVTHFPGSGKFVITGQLGEVMKESASIALDYLKSNAKKYNLSKFDFAKTDIHIHAPEGAIKKDGPSAGVTLITAIYSALTGKKVRHDIAMTGEVTLRGDVLAIGGLKEKAISAHRSNIKTIVIPKQNEKDLDEIPTSVKDDLEIIFASHIETVLEHAIYK